MKFVVAQKETMPILAALAKTIWHECYGELLGERQVNYMLDTIQSLPAMLKQQEQGMLYYVLMDNQEACGYMALVIEEEKVFLSKLYILKQKRGKGALTLALEIIAGFNKSSVYLTVNRHNNYAIKAYLSKGFKIVKEEDNAIGEGFVMNDYIMEKQLT